ncbi:2-phospho-L-lactate guanylyltransferase [Microbacterium sp. LRZ72]|uniref:2-phospho-L-lactate guanylyltransferase n=1 Tax=Microbacterium sp. LRZ72 TaxID=2942481 RepID=UPI0029B7CEDB|nr:2-phospho-L-lactate guanylyltransferase [Microbacterium sp. LRZ72]MDX2376420.1 2-phospho-L-lactate guanylyltransferase [Microbacterium sp. LRZ72]
MNLAHRLDWVVIVPVKPAVRGKSRLRVGGVDRERLARAIALDTIVAAADVARVVVVTDDADVAAALASVPRVRVLPENGGDGLNAAIARGARHAGTDRPRAALLGDLPALTAHDLDEALAQAESLPRAVAPDAEGVGSTLVTAAAGVELITAFGPDSLHRHVAAGCRALDIPATSSLRRDVDTAAHLDQARGLGLGPRTAGLLEATAPHGR